MSIDEIERALISCLKDNLVLSGEDVPAINKETRPGCDLGGFDSLRTIEVLLAVEEKINFDIEPDKVLANIYFKDATISTISQAILKLRKGTGK